MLSIVSIISETVKTLINIVPNEAGTAYYLADEQLPFHLCSLQIFLIFYLDFICKDEGKKEKILNFMFPTMLLGGIAAMLIPTEGATFTNVQTYQYFIYHTFLVYFAIYIIKNKLINITYKSILRNYGIIIFLAYVMICVNSMLKNQNANYLYVSRPPMEGLPILNLNNGWLVYFISLLSIVIIMLGLVQLPFVKKNKK